MCGFSIPSNSLILCGHQLGVLQFSSFQTLNTQSTGCTSLGLGLKYCSPFRCPSQVLGACTADQLVINWGFHDLLLRFSRLIEWLTELSRVLYLLLLYFIEDMIKDTNEQPGEEVHWAKSRRVRSTEASVPWNKGTPPFLRVFTKSETVWTLSFRGFKEVPLHRYDC